MLRNYLLNNPATGQFHVSHYRTIVGNKPAQLVVNNLYLPFLFFWREFYFRVQQVSSTLLRTLLFIEVGMFRMI